MLMPADAYLKDVKKVQSMRQERQLYGEVTGNGLDESVSREGLSLRESPRSGVSCEPG